MCLFDGILDLAFTVYSINCYWFRVQVDDDDDYYDGPDNSDYETDDSNGYHLSLSHTHARDIWKAFMCPLASMHTNLYGFLLLISGENNPLNDYPDEEESEDDEATSRSSDEESVDKSRTSGSQSQGSESESQASNGDENSGPDYWSDDADRFSENEMYSDWDVDNYSGDELR